MLDFPDDEIDWVVSEDAKDLVRKLICPREVITLLNIKLIVFRFVSDVMASPILRIIHSSLESIGMLLEIVGFFDI